MRTDEYVYTCRCLTLYWSIHGAVGMLHTRLLLSNFQQMYILLVYTTYMYMYMYMYMCIVRLLSVDYVPCYLLLVPIVCMYMYMYMYIVYACMCTFPLSHFLPQSVGVLPSVQQLQSSLQNGN